MQELLCKGCACASILPQWERLPRQEFIRSLWGITDYTILKCFQWGLFPTYSNLVGVDKFQAAMPLLAELVRTGWQPLVPVRVSLPGKEIVWTSRYGTGAGNAIVLASPNEAPVAAQVTVANALLGPSDCVYADWRDPSRPVTQQLSHRETRLRQTLPRRDLVVLRSVLGVRAAADLTAVARLERDLDQITATIELTAPAATKAEFELPVLRGWQASEVTVAGKAVQTGKPVKLGAGATTVTVRYRSETFGFSQAALDGFGFLGSDGKVGFCVVAPEPQRRDYQRLSRRFQQYFRFYAERVQGRKGMPDVPVVAAAAQAPCPSAVVLDVAPGATPPGWSLGNGGLALTLNAADEAEALRCTGELLRALDAKHKFTVPFLGGMSGMYQPVQEKHRMIGKTLSQMLKEEGLQ